MPATRNHAAGAPLRDLRRSSDLAFAFSVFLCINQRSLIRNTAYLLQQSFWQPKNVFLCHCCWLRCGVLPRGRESEREKRKLISAKTPVILMPSILCANSNMNTSVDGWQKKTKLPQVVMEGLWTFHRCESDIEMERGGDSLCRLTRESASPWTTKCLWDVYTGVHL